MWHAAYRGPLRSTAGQAGMCMPGVSLLMYGHQGNKVHKVPSKEGARLRSESPQLLVVGSVPSQGLGAPISHRWWLWNYTL